MVLEHFDPGQIIFLTGVYFGMMYWIAKEFQFVSHEKGYSSNRYFWICIILPLAGWILVAALPSRTNTEHKDKFDE